MTRPLSMIPDAEMARSSSSIDDDHRGFGALKTEKGHLPLEAMDVRGRIDGLLARVVVRQTFVNAFDEPLEAAYIFPLPDRAAVTRFRMSVSGREIDGVLEERGQARENYDRAIAEGRRASIAEEDRPGVFNLRVGNIMPGERATVELTLCGVLPYTDGEVIFRFPLVVAPRYIPGKALPGPSAGDGTAVDTDAVPDASRITPPVLLPGFPNPVRLSLEVELHDGSAAADEVRSSLHAVQEDAHDGYRRIRIQHGERLDRDFILRFRLGGEAIASTLTLHPDADDHSQGTFALTIVPPASGREAATRPRDVVFLLDRSGSMEGWKIVAARRALARMIDTLGEADRFAVMAFDSVIETPPALPGGLAAGDDRNRFRAVEYLATVDARDGTEMAEPLDRAVKLMAADQAEDRDRILVLITDGQVGNEDELLSTLGKRLGRIRVHTIGIDQAVNEGFLRRLAERGGGSCELVESEDRLDEVMAAIHRRIGTPLLGGLSLDARGISVEPGEIVPRRLPDLFPGSPLLILGRYRGDARGEIATDAKDAAGAPYFETVAGSLRENPAIAAAWARGQIRQLEDRYAAGDGDRPDLEKAIVALSLRFQVLCRFTAYVAVDRSQVVNPGGETHRITQPVEMPAGWEMLSSRRPSMARGAGFRGQAYGGPPAGGGRARSRGSVRELRVDATAAPPPVDGLRASAAPSRPAQVGPDYEMLPLRVGAPGVSFTWTPEGMGLLAFRDGHWRRMPPKEAAQAVAQAAESMQQLHDQGRVYGSLVYQKLQHACGNDSSMSPEQAIEWCLNCTPPEWLTRPIGPPVPSGDIYALGAALYVLLAGRMPFAGTAEEIEAQVLRAELIPPRRLVPSIPAALEAICLKAIARPPEERYATAGELAKALRDFLKPRRKAFWK